MDASRRALTKEQLARLSELLDQVLPLPAADRRVWLDILSDADRPLVQSLRDALLADDLSSAAGGPLDRLPCIETTCTRDGGAIDHHAGERFGAYELLRPLGAGGMAEVWLAHRADGAFEREVALKIPHLRDMPAAMAERFARECRILATLETPNIARLYDAGVDANGVPYVAMEYVRGEPLVAWCDARQLDTPARIRVFMKMLDAVNHAHERQVLHRDLKPSNILITEQGDVRLLDFGVARLLQADEDGEQALTRGWGRALTPEYASPELLRGEVVDARSDIYSLGVVLHELLTGSRPGQTASGGSATGTLRGGLREVVMKALAPAPADRYPDVARFAAVLQPFAGAEAVPAGVLRFGKRQLWVAGLAALALAAGGTAVYRMRAATVPATADAFPGDATPSVQTIAVLPFANLSGDPGQEYFSDGLTEELLNQLAAIPGLRVTGRTSSFSFKGKNDDLRVIAKKLGVANLLEGSVRRDGRKLRITAQLIDGRDGAHRWSHTYEREYSGIFAVQDEIARDVAQALSVTLDLGKLPRAQGGTTSVEAYDRYLRWRDLEMTERYGVEADRQRVQLMREAVEIDPAFVVAWDGLGRSLTSLAQEVGSPQAGPLLVEAEQAFGRVEALAPDSWVALRKRSEDLFRDQKWAEAEAVARKLLDSGPLNFDRAQPYINVIAAAGRIEETIVLQGRVMALEPQALFVSRDQQWNLYIAGRSDESEAEYQRSKGLVGSPTDPDELALLRMLARKDADPQTLRAQCRLAFQDQEYEDFQQWVPDFCASIPDRKAMLTVLRKAFAGGTTCLHKVADALGDMDLAFDFLQRCVARGRGKTGIIWWQPWLMPHSGARADARFKQLMIEAGLADYWRESGHWPDACKPVGEADFECR